MRQHIFRSTDENSSQLCTHFLMDCFYCDHVISGLVKHYEWSGNPSELSF